jgi:hypothetical protein
MPCQAKKYFFCNSRKILADLKTGPPHLQDGFVDTAIFRVMFNLGLGKKLSASINTDQGMLIEKSVCGLFYLK